MLEIKGTKTYDNLLIAYAGESQARNKYIYFAEKAKKEGYIQIAEIFEETANNEQEHAELWYKYFAGIDSTEENLKTAAAGEHYEWSEMYADMARVARDEGFEQIAAQMEAIAKIEMHHEERYLKLRENIQKQEVFEKKESAIWICSNCGYEHEGKKAPEICPVCFNEKGYFKIKAKNY